ncbi:MAG: lipid A deacylase LpxR family protein [Proteobacteria bacterium]|nr:lipid A deacylase LpxR family protein [Pseudomonadota bacterium]
MKLLTMGLWVNVLLGWPIVSPADNNIAENKFAACSPLETIQFRGGTLRLENDSFTDTDQNYTNGVSLTMVSHDIHGQLRPECLSVPSRLFMGFIQRMNPGFWNDMNYSADSQNVVFRLGQSMYTPEDFTRTDLIVDDRPYAGLLYTGLAWNRRKFNPKSNLDMLDTREITVGVIGPLSLAEQAQNLVHDAFGDERFLGWDNQLENEPALQLALDRKYKYSNQNAAITPGFSADSIRSLGLRLGNIETSATIGIEGRIGWNLPNDFGSYPIRPGAENRPPSAGANGDDAQIYDAKPAPGIHLFVTLEAKAVGYDFSLDGNLFRSSHSVSRRPWIVQAAIGISGQGNIAGHGYRLALMHVYRTREYDQQLNDHSYGSLALSFEF